MYTPNNKKTRNVLDFIPGDTFNDMYIMAAEKVKYTGMDDPDYGWCIKLTVAEYEDGENSHVCYVATACQTDHWTW